MRLRSSSNTVLPALNEPILIHRDMPKCSGDVATCLLIKQLTQTMQEYVSKQDSMSYLNELHDGIVATLNNFNHALFEHDRDEEFDYIYSTFDGECEFPQCQIVRSHRRHIDQDKDEDDYRAHNVRYWMDIMHRHYLHSYDLAYRFRANEREMDRMDLMKRCVALRNKRNSVRQSMRDAVTDRQI